MKTEQNLENITQTQYVDEAGNPIDPSLIDANGNYIGETTQYVDEMGNPIDPSLIDANGNYIGSSVQSQSLAASDIAGQLGSASGSDGLLVTGVETQPIHSSEHQMDDKEMFSGMVTFDYNNVPITDIVNSIILDAINKGASDIHFDPFDEGIKIRIRIDGALNDYSIVPLYVKKNMITRIKIISGMNITESRTPQDGAIRTELANKTIDLRVSCLPTNLGEKIVIRIMDYSMSAAGIEGLDFNEENLEKIKKMLDLPNGIILVTGATGSGKSTTVYSMLQRINVEGTNIITVEDPIEMNIGGINQVQAVAEIGLDFATVLRSILRQDPDVIMIGEIRDEETAKIAVRASITGHLVLSTIHTNNSLNTIERLTDMNVERYLLGSALSGVISQKLSRRLCDKCKKLRPTNDYEKDMFKKLLDKDVDEIYEAVGCPECQKGYRGRIAIQEVLLLNQQIKDAIIKGANKAYLRKLVYGNNGTLTMLQDGLNKVLDGKTSFEEILKLIDLDDDLGKDTELGLEDQIDAATMTNNFGYGYGAPQQAVATGPININLPPELLASLQAPQVVKPVIVSADDIDDDDLDEETQKSILKKLTKRKSKKKAKPREDIVIEEVEVENEPEIDEILEETDANNEDIKDIIIDETDVFDEIDEIKDEDIVEETKEDKEEIIESIDIDEVEPIEIENASLTEEIVPDDFKLDEGIFEKELNDGIEDISYTDEEIDEILNISIDDEPVKDEIKEESKEEKDDAKPQKVTKKTKAKKKGKKASKTTKKKTEKPKKEEVIEEEPIEEIKDIEELPVTDEIISDNVDEISDDIDSLDNIDLSDLDDLDELLNTLTEDVEDIIDNSDDEELDLSLEDLDDDINITDDVDEIDLDNLMDMEEEN